MDTPFDNQPAVSAELRQKVTGISKMLEAAIMAVRDLSYELRPPSLDQLGLVQFILGIGKPLLFWFPCVFERNTTSPSMILS